MNHLLERLGGFAARRYWIFIIAWVIILGGLIGANHAFGGEYVNNYNVPGSGSVERAQPAERHLPASGRLRGADRLPRTNGTVTRSSRRR